MHPDNPLPVVLSIAGSDSGGGAGIQADVKAIQASGAFAATVVTAVTAQNTYAVTAAYELPPEIVRAQLDAVFDDLRIDAVKTGMLATARLIRLVADALRERYAGPLVVDPVMVSTSGHDLLEPEAVAVLRDTLLPVATLVTPNAPEAERLAGGPVRTLAQAEAAARTIHAMGPGAVLVKGGHLGGGESVDVLFDGERVEHVRAPRVETVHTHGTGCTLASAVAAHLAAGLPVGEAVRRGKAYLTEAIRRALPIGSGHGPVDHFWMLREG